MKQATATHEPVQQAGEARSRALVIAIPMPDPLLTINARQKMYWRVQGRHGKAQRGDAMLCAYAAMAPTIDTLRAVPFPAGKVRADVQVYRRPRQKVCDDTALWEALKPIFDGFEDAGVFGIGDEQVVAGTLTWFPTDPEPRIEITLTGVD